MGFFIFYFYITEKKKARGALLEHLVNSVKGVHVANQMIVITIIAIVIVESIDELGKNVPRWYN